MTGVTTYTPEMADVICERLADGESLRSICKAPGMPHRITVLRWVSENEAFRNQYARAREGAADAFAEEIIGIADDSAADPNDRRIRVDARKWVAAKLKPKSYGDKVTNEHTGADGGPLVVKIINFVDAGDHSPE